MKIIIRIKYVVKTIFLNFFPTDLWTRLLGHREAVGGAKNWDSLGSWQLDFLKSKGLKKDSKLLDAACGSLRLGSKAIPFLNSANYMGFDRDEHLIQMGLKNELANEVIASKKPNLICVADFNLDKLDNFDFCIAQSLVSHLNDADTTTFFSAVRQKANVHSLFYFSFPLSETSDYARKPLESGKSSNYRFFFYSVDYLEAKLAATGWVGKYIGTPAGYTWGQKWFECEPK